jgi:hypothetical protein
MFYGEALVGPEAKNAWPWQQLVRELVDPGPPGAVLLAAPHHGAHPEHHDAVPERRQGIEVSWPTCQFMMRSHQGRRAGETQHNPQSVRGRRGGLPRPSAGVARPRLAAQLLSAARHFWVRTGPVETTGIPPIPCLFPLRLPEQPALSLRECERKSSSGKCCRTSHRRCRRRLGVNCSPAMQMRT